MNTNQSRLTMRCSQQAPRVTVAAARRPAAQLPRRAPPVADLVLVRPCAIYYFCRLRYKLRWRGCRRPAVRV
jgi:hypothetical protein